VQLIGKERVRLGKPVSGEGFGNLDLGQFGPSSE
jgi:hypothetical protein